MDSSSTGKRASPVIFTAGMVILEAGERATSWPLISTARALASTIISIPKYHGLQRLFVQGNRQASVDNLTLSVLEQMKKNHAVFVEGGILSIIASRTPGREPCEADGLATLIR
mmetsp:Transcript_23614/g.40067  ORF Transcript_23614/g.40067 Transcript_23614/m.40067 type:complete len:114 (+) Transcript_23614:225-566(+)